MRRPLRSFAVAASLAFSIAALPSPASAQSNPNHDEAVRLFQLGKNQRDAGDCKEAIKALEASVKLEESIGGRYNLGVCHEKQNAFKKALANYKKAEEIAKERNDDRLREIRAQLADFLDKTPHIRLALPQPLPPDLRVTVDGDAIPTEDLQGETIYFLPTASEKNASFDVRASATGYEDVKLNVDASAVKKKILVTVVMRKPDGSTARPPVRERETKWGPFQFLGLGLIALGAAGMTFSSVSYVAYRTREQKKLDLHRESLSASNACKARRDAMPTTDCTDEISAEQIAREDYLRNESDAEDKTALWLTTGIGGLLAVGGGVLLIVVGPRTEVAADPGSTAKTVPKPELHIVPTWTAREQGISLFGTF